MDEEDNEPGNVINLFGGDILKVEVGEEDIPPSHLLNLASDAGWDKMIILGVGGGDVGFITNISTYPEIVYLMERIKHYLITIGDESE